jgi:hypothetical protein
MIWLDRLLGRPTEPLFLADLRDALRRAGFGELHHDVPADRITGADASGSRHHFFLGNVRATWVASPRSGRGEVIARHLRSVAVAGDAGLPASYAEVRKHLLPVVRHAHALANDFADLESLADPGSAPRGFVARPWVGELALVLMFDRPDSMVQVPLTQLADWGVDEDTAFADALDNLRHLPEAGGWAPLAPGVWSGEWGDSYESSRLLLPDLVHRLGVAEPVALVPFRHALVIASARDPEALRRMGEAVLSQLESQGRRLSMQPLVLEERAWRPFVPPPEAAAPFHALRLHERADLYERQKRLLDSANQREERDVFVASFQIFRRHATDTLHALSVWGRDVETLLPESELVALQRSGSEDAVFVPWDALHEAGLLVPEPGSTPPRWRVGRYPPDHVLERLFAAQIAV